MAFFPGSKPGIVKTTSTLCMLSYSGILGADWKGYPLGRPQGPYSCLRPMMPPIQHVSAVGRVPPCETTKLLSLRHLSLAKFIPLHCTYSYSHQAQPTTLSSQELSSRNAECINNQQTFICLPFNVWPQQVRHSEFGVERQATMPACGV
jgi:hypothetical protein